MPVVFTELFEKECEKPFGITRQQVAQAYTEPDEYQKLLSQGLELWMYVKKIGKFHLLVIGNISNGNLMIHLAFKMRPDLVEISKTKKPLELAEMLAIHYGLQMTIGTQTSKFIYNSIIPRDQRLPMTQIVKVHNPENHGFVQSMFVRVNDDGSGKQSVQCAIAFCIDKDRYSSWIAGL